MNHATRAAFLPLVALLCGANPAAGQAQQRYAALAAHVLIANSQWASMAVEDMLTPALNRFTFGETRVRWLRAWRFLHCEMPSR
jgi:hypothetical protein